MRSALLSSRLLLAAIGVGLGVSFSNTAAAQVRGTLYFPMSEEWETTLPRDAGWKAGKLKDVAAFAEESKSSGLIILQDGRIIVEQYWQPKEPSSRYRGMLHGTTSRGQAIEDVASCQKSVVSFLVGIAQEKKLININDPVSKYLDRGWSKATVKQESRITVRHLLTMTSGLNEQLEYEVAPGTKWQYNTGAYSLSRTVVCTATKKTPNEVTQEWLTGPLGMNDSKWVLRRNAGTAVNKLGFTTSARDLSRFGLMVLDRGRWKGKTILADQDYLKSALTRSQTLNPSYGYLWWLNSKKSRKIDGRIIDRPLIPSAPLDLVGAFGALSRKCYVVSSLNLVVVRLGDEPTDKRKFQEELWRLIMAARRSS